MNDYTEEEQEEWEDAVLTITGHPQWQHIMRGLAREIQNSQANVFTKNSWDEVNIEKGFVKGLFFVATLRNSVLMERKNREDNADL